MGLTWPSYKFFHCDFEGGWGAREADVETKLKIEAKLSVAISFDILILTNDNLLLFALFIGSKIQLNTETEGK